MNLTKKELDSLLDFIELEFIPAVKKDPYFDNIEYISYVCAAWKKLKELAKKMEEAENDL